MSISGLHLTRIGHGDFLLDPLKSLNIRDQDRLIVEVTAYLLQMRAVRLYYDLSDLALIDPLYYSWLESLARATRTINVSMICVGMQPTAAFSLAQFLQKMPTFQTALEIDGYDTPRAAQAIP
jgi:rsbT antagonist protein RsbS